jgi:2-polyprenyl-3-methyl-5-hydroxy-6-metoxy-1,4-benzoquinol methylase
MSEKPEDAAKRDVAALAAELVGQIASLSAFAGSGLASQGLAGARHGSTSSTAGIPSYAGPRTMLENAGRFVSPVLPAGAALRPIKAALLRVLRIVTRDQTTFNSALLEALRGALLETEASLKGLASASAEASAEAGEAGRRAEAAAGAAGERVDRAVADLSAVSVRVGREAAARESAGRDLAASQRRLDALEKDRDARFEALARRQEREEAERKSFVDRLDATAETLRAVKLEWSSLRSNLQTLSEGRTPLGAATGTEASSAVRPDDPLRAGLYVDFEEHFRGSEADIRARQAKDAARFRGAARPVADLGCGRGEFLEALKAEGVTGIGCDANPVMAARATEKGLAVDAADLFTWLGARPDESLSGITAFQVVEHLAPASLFDLVELAVQKLAPGGRVLFETVNPESVYAMRWFWMDLTHVRPVPAPSLAQLLRASGLKDVEVDFRSPVPDAEGLPAGLAEDPRFAPLARLLFAPQDYAVTGVK